MNNNIDEAIDRITAKRNALEPLVDDEFQEALLSIKNQGYNPILAVVAPNTVIPEGVNNCYGLPVEHRRLHTPDGEIIPIAFEVEDHKLIE